MSVMNRGRYFAAAFIVLLVLAASVGAWAWLSVRGRPRPTNVLLISIDTLRADRLGCYGHAGGATPNIDALAARGVVFQSCTTSAPITLPAHTSLMTGTYPFVHGVRDNGFFRVHPDNVTLAELLGGGTARYKTAAVVASFVLNREFGLEQGFDVYDDVRGTGGQTAQFGERSAGEVAERAIGLIAGMDAGRPWFLFVHFFDPHQPYEAPAPFAQRFADPYLAEIAYVDHHVGRIIEEIRRRDLERDTLIVITADHGEGKGDHNEESHAGFVYDSTTSIPLIMAQPERIPAARRVSAQTRIIDIAPTILAHTGAGAVSVEMQGVDLSPLVTGEKADLDLTAYAETFYPRFNYGFAALRALRARGWKYIHAPTPELYEVRRDPAELFNVAESEPDRLREFQAALKELLERSTAAVDAGAARRDASAQEVAVLRSLGYAGGAGDEESPASTESLEHFGPDPKAHVAEMGLMDRALGQLRLGRVAEAEASLREAIARSAATKAAMPWAHANLATVLASQGRQAEAVEHYREALAQRPGDGRVWGNLGLALLKLDRVNESIEALEAALKRPPVFAYAYVDLARALWHASRFREARSALESGLAAFPDDRELARSLAWILATCSRDDVRDGKEAVRLATAACDPKRHSTPASADLLDTLAAALAEAGDFDQALKVLAEARAAAATAGKPEFERALAAREDLYRSKRPYRSP